MQFTYIMLDRYDSVVGMLFKRMEMVILNNFKEYALEK